jgi:hypothetical protein
MTARRRLLAAAFAVATLLAPAAGAAQSPLDVARTWGLLGTWAFACWT